MIREKIIVPSGIRYISDWNEFRFNNFPEKCIINKQLPGCGFTEYCIRSNENIILCSPRKMLLKNKKDQHKFDVYLVVNEMDKESNIDKDLSKIDKNVVIDNLIKEEMSTNSEIYKRLYHEIEEYCISRSINGLPCKILVTYDSYRIVKDILEKLDRFYTFYTIVDEFQSILHDSRFKSDTELKFLEYLKQSPTAYFVSATPMMNEYLEMLDEFKDLPYYELDWSEDLSRIIKPDLDVFVMRSVGEKMSEIIQKYLSGDFEEIVVMRNGIPTKVISNEAVFYVNSVNHITSIIKKNNLTPEQCNILCSKTDDNLKKIQKRLGKKFIIGEVPLERDPHKMFTFCTRTVYLGADFYSLCARSFIFSDSNIDSLAVDISEDLPQILGRQRLKENPWKNSATFYYRSTANYREMKAEDFQKIIDDKMSMTESLLRVYSTTFIENDKYSLAKTYQENTQSYNYKSNYVAVNKITTKDGNIILKPVYNNLVLVNEIRAFKIQQIDYKDRFTVFSTVHNTLTRDDIVNQEVSKFLKIYTFLTTIYDKLKLLCEYGLSNDAIQIVLGQIADSDEIKSYYTTLGPQKLKSLSYNSTKIKNYLGIVTFSQELLESSIYSEFKVGDIWLLSDIKSRLECIYNNINYDKIAKANDLLNYFEIQETMLRKEINGEKKRVKVYKILKKKE
nr:MAG: Origin of replication binding protein [Bacteriophage sp.]